MNEAQIREIAKGYGTPVYAFEESELIKRVELIKSIVPESVKLCFAMKANPFLTGTMNKLVERLEVCSPGEYEICIREKIDPAKIIVSGVNKTVQSMDRIFSYSKGEGIYTIESPLHYDILHECAQKHNLVIKVLPRLSSGNQFGMDEETLERVLDKVCSDQYMIPVGIHYYSGTQKKMKKVEKELASLSEYAKKLKEKYSIDELELEYGPGLMVSYFENEADVDAGEQLEELAELLKTVSEFDHIAIEMGRFLVSYCGTYITRVMDVKKTGDSRFLIVDGGIHQLSYYGQLMGMKKPYIKLIKDEKRSDYSSGAFNICGSLCTVNDVIVRDVEFTDIAKCDILAFERCGAYSVTEGMALFLSRELPAVVLVGNDKTIRVLRDVTQINILNSPKEDD